MRLRNAMPQRAWGWPSPRTSPEDVFLLWLLGLPEGADPAQAAQAEIDRLDRAAPLAAGPLRLRALMLELAQAGSAGGRHCVAAAAEARGR